MPIFVLHAEKLFTSFGVLEKSVSPTFFFFHGLASRELSWEQITSPELRLPRLCTQVHLASGLFSWDKYPHWRLCSCPGTWPPHQITIFELNLEHPLVQAELSPMCHQMKPFWGHEGSTATILVPAHFSLSLWFCSLLSSFNHLHDCMSHHTDLVSNHFSCRSQNLRSLCPSFTAALPKLNPRKILFAIDILALRGPASLICLWNGASWFQHRVSANLPAAHNPFLHLKAVYSFRVKV